MGFAKYHEDNVEMWVERNLNQCYYSPLQSSHQSNGLVASIIRKSCKNTIKLNQPSEKPLQHKNPITFM